MEIKEQIVRAIAADLRPLLYKHVIHVRCDHGCWEVLTRREDRHKLFECTIDEHDDTVCISYGEDYPLQKDEVLSDPTWIPRFYSEVQRRLGYGNDH